MQSDANVQKNNHTALYLFLGRNIILRRHEKQFFNETISYVKKISYFCSL
jgi:hypothetical protein